MTTLRWRPTPAELVKAHDQVAYDRLPPAFDAVFVHGAPLRDDDTDVALLTHVVNAIDGRCPRPRVVLNGLTAEQCREGGIAYAGYEGWMRLLCSLGVGSGQIDLLPDAWHTAAEADALMRYAIAAGHDQIVVATYNHHALRSMLSMVAAMDRAGVKLPVFALAAPPILLGRQFAKPVMKDGTGATGDVVGTIEDHIVAENERIVMYAQAPPLGDGGRPTFTPHATIPQLYEYLEWRDRAG